MQSFVQLYTGNGKGKTTAALGLAMRAAGAGKRIFIGQFIKGMHYSELELLTEIPAISLKQYGRGCFIGSEPTAEDYLAAQAGLRELSQILAAGEYDMVILDEACIALHFNLIELTSLLTAIEQRAEHVEVIVTGRYAPRGLIDAADLVTEMLEVKHYYSKGVAARVGIEK